MDWQFQLIADYIVIESTMQCSSVARRWRRGEPTFTDAEVLTCYCMGLRRGLRRVVDIHRLASCELADWFPGLPCYEQFLRRLNRLGPYCRQLCEKQFDDNEKDHSAIDSAPVIVAEQARSGRARVAPNICDKGYNASKKKYFYGFKLHVACDTRNSAPYSIVFAEISPASTHDIQVLKRTIQGFRSKFIHGDKAYRSYLLLKKASSMGKTIITPLKKCRGERTQRLDVQLVNSLVSSTRQVVETAIGWINQRTGILRASHLRSSKGIIRHTYIALLGLSLGVI